MSSPSHDEQILADQPLDADDERALALIRAHLEAADPVPSDLAERVKFAMTVASLEAEVAHLMGEASLAGAVRTTDYDRATTVTFESEGLSIMVMLEEADRGVTTIRGWVTVPGAEVELRERSRSATTTADDEGRFVFEGVERGTVHLVIRHAEEPGARPVITPGIEI
jgi:hypothetical protein